MTRCHTGSRGWFRYSAVTREGDHALPWVEHWNECEYSITHHIDWNAKGYTPYDLYCTQGLADMIAGGSLASIREDARTIFKDRSLTDDYLSPTPSGPNRNSSALWTT